MELVDAKALLETEVSETLTSSTSTSTDTEPPEKRAKTDIIKVFDKIIEAGASTGTTSASSL